LRTSGRVYDELRNTLEDATLAPLSPYALHKRIGEQYACLYSELYGLETVALRYFNVYGPRQDPASPYSRVIARFAAAAREGKPVALTGDGSQTPSGPFHGKRCGPGNHAQAVAPLSVCSGLSPEIR
jgi:nucleoside-diphosphate-sugar epimerase